MQIEINKKLRVKQLDEFNYTYEVLKTVVNRTTKEEKEKWITPNGYFRTATQAIEKALESELKRISDKDFDSIKKYLIFMREEIINMRNMLIKGCG